MRRQYANPVTTALPDVGSPEPRVLPWLIGLARLILGAYLRFVLGFERVEFRHGELLVEAYEMALGGKQRLILAFRHPYGDEPQLLSWTFGRGVEIEARRMGVRLPRRPHAVFVHGYEVPRWSGAFIRWLLPRTGSMPVHHSKMDSSGMARIRAAIEDGPYPLALSPEGQVSYTSDDVPRLEAGAIRLGFQSADRLERDGRRERVVILPVSVHYRYGRRAWASLERLVGRIEAFAGIGPNTGMDGADLRQRLAAATGKMIGLAEKAYGLAAPSGGRPDGSADILSDGRDGNPDERRVRAVVEAALDSAERLLGIGRGAGDGIERLYRIRQAGWDRVFLPPAEDPRRATTLERAILDRRAGEAWYAMRHMELADFAWYFRPGHPPAPAGRQEGASPPHELVEYAQSLWDFANRMAGGAISGRIDVRPKRAIVAFADPIDLSARLDGYRADRKAATAAALGELMHAYQSSIKENLHEI